MIKFTVTKYNMTLFYLSKLSPEITVLVIAECFGMMPVRGVTRSHPRYLSFSWTSFRTIYCLVFILCSSVDSIFTIYRVLNKPITFNNIGK